MGIFKYFRIFVPWDLVADKLAKVPEEDILYKEGNVRGTYKKRKGRSVKTMKLGFGIAATEDELLIAYERGTILRVPWKDGGRWVELKMNVKVEEMNVLYLSWMEDKKLQELRLDVPDAKEAACQLKKNMKYLYRGKRSLPASRLPKKPKSKRAVARPSSPKSKRAVARAA